jgi:hypothetical protein
MSSVNELVVPSYKTKIVLQSINVELEDDAMDLGLGLAQLKESFPEGITTTDRAIAFAEFFNKRWEVALNGNILSPGNALAILNPLSKQMLEIKKNLEDTSK